MARTRSRRRRTGPRTASSVPDLLTVLRVLARPEIAGTVLVVLAAAALPQLLPLAGVLDDARDGLVRALGLHAFTAVVATGAVGAMLALRRAGWVGRRRRHLLGVLALLLFAAGLLGRWFPEAAVGAVDLASQSAGGTLGRRLTEDAPATLAWAAMLPLGFALLWPRAALSLLRAVPVTAGAAIAGAWRLRLDRRFVRAVRAPLRRRAASADARRELAAAVAGAAEAGSLDQIAGPPMAQETAGANEEAGAVAAFGERAPFAAEPAHDADEAPAERRPAAQIPMDMEIAAGDLRHSSDGWQLPPVSLLADVSTSGGGDLDSERRARVIEETLASFGIDARVAEINEGPSITQFGVEPGWDVRTRTVLERDASGRRLLDEHGQPRSKEAEVSRTRVRVSRITALQNDLALALAAPALRIEAPVPGKQLVGIEVPNLHTATVSMRAVLESPAFRKAAQRGVLPVALGTAVSGEAVVADLASMPHLLIAGATGSGKSVCLNAVITCLLINHSPEQLRLVLIDPKRVELTPFTGVPHLAFSEIIVDMDRVVGTLQAVTNEMESRFRRFAQAGVRDIARYNEQVEGRELPYWVVVIDELADLMVAAPYQVEKQVVRLAQLARATGIHVVIATQRPSVDVVTGLIKANFPTRIAFAVASQVDSRTVLDHAGAEKLLGRGDMLFQATDAQQPRRVQGVYVSDEETEAVVDFWTSGRFGNEAPEKHDDLLRDAERQVEEMESQETSDDDDPMLQKALELARQLDGISTSLLQRKLRIGYPRAARIMDELELRGIVGAAEPGGSSRPVLVGPEAALFATAAAEERGGESDR